MMAAATEKDLAGGLAVDAARQASAATAPVPKHVAKDLVHGTSALGAGLIVERGFGFLANLLAARIGGAGVFGAYALALSTANNVSSYAAGGIGSTAVRFSGKYARDSAGYRALVRALLLISGVSAALAALVLWAGAKPLAQLLGKPGLTGLLHWAAVSAAGIILLECCRGFLVGQRRIPAILLLSLTVGIGMLLILPLTARLGPVAMISSQGALALGAVAVCLLLSGPLGLLPAARSQAAENTASMVRAVWSFGGVQLAGLVGMNAAGWWLTTLVARADHTLVQMGFLAISHQLRNMVGLFPGLLTESSLAVMARGGKGEEKTPDQVMAVCIFVTTLVSFAAAGFGMLLAPWGLAALYGKTYAGAAAATALALATAVVHMSSSPASARLSIVSIRMTGLINTAWAVVVAGAATLFFFEGGSAAAGTAIYLGAHLLSAVLVLAYLGQAGCVGQGVRPVLVLGWTGSLVLAAAAVLRSARPAWSPALSLAMALIWSGGLLVLVRMGRRHGWVPNSGQLRRMAAGRIPWAQRWLPSGGVDA